MLFKGCMYMKKNNRNPCQIIVIDDSNVPHVFSPLIIMYIYVVCRPAQKRHDPRRDPKKSCQFKIGPWAEARGQKNASAPTRAQIRYLLKSREDNTYNQKNDGAKKIKKSRFRSKLGVERFQIYSLALYTYTIYY